MYTHMVEKRGYSLADFVGLISANAARIMGLYPRKGALAVGSDADIVLLDPRARRVLRKEDLHETDYTPWEGHEVAAWPSMTILRGKIVVENGRFLAAPERRSVSAAQDRRRHPLAPRGLSWNLRAAVASDARLSPTRVAARSRASGLGAELACWLQ